MTTKSVKQTQGKSKTLKQKESPASKRIIGRLTLFDVLIIVVIIMGFVFVFGSLALIEGGRMP